MYEVFWWLAQGLSRWNTTHSHRSSLLCPVFNEYTNRPEHAQLGSSTWIRQLKWSLSCTSFNWQLLSNQDKSLNSSLAQDLPHTHSGRFTQPLNTLQQMWSSRNWISFNLCMTSRSNILTRFVSSNRHTGSLLQKIRYGWVTHIYSPTSIRLKHGICNACNTD